ncbi:MAG TPA: metallophosphoesterase [Cyclobacteriaceae bacterium]
MKIQYCSDLHLEFKENKQYLSENPLQPKGDVLVLAGDIVPLSLMKKHDVFFDYVADHFETTYWIPGNHEYYHYDLADKCGSFEEKIRSNVSLINNKAVDHGEIRFVFSTLWSYISPLHQLDIQRGMYDFHVIKYKTAAFTVRDYNEQHETCLAFLKEELNTKSLKKTVVATHHVPTFMNYPTKYRDSILNEAFAVELYDIIEPSDAAYWIYGHHHQSIPEFSIGSTRLINNQLGYVKYNENQSFNSSAVIEL